MYSFTRGMKNYFVPPLSLNAMHIFAIDKEPSQPNGDEDIFPTGPEEIVNAPAPFLARILSLAGHVALLQLYHLDVNIFAELKRRHRIREEEKEKQGQKTKKTPKRQSVKDNTASSVSSKQVSKNCLNSQVESVFQRNL